MDHEVVPRPYNICDWLVNSSHNHFGLHQGEDVGVAVEFEVPKRHFLRPTLSSDMVQPVLRWERRLKRCFARKKKGQGPVTYRNCYTNFSNETIYGEEKVKRGEDKTMVKLQLFQK